jgi:glycosyltransferase involved in cell wall biosynthesis
MRILYICLDRGITLDGAKGASIHTAEMIRALEAEGHAVAVLGRISDPSRAPHPVVAPPDSEGFRWIGHKTLRRDLRLVAEGARMRDAVRRAIDAFAPDVVYERYSLFRSETVMECRRARLPVILEVNAPLAREEARFRRLVLSRLARRAERKAWRNADLVVVPSTPLKALVASTGQDRVLVVPNSVDPDRFRLVGKRDDLRNRLGLKGHFTVGFAGSMKPWHDLAVLVEAVSSLPDDVGATLLLVGEGPERPTFERFSSQRGVRTVWTGAVPYEDVPAFIECMDVCVVTLPAESDLHYFSPLKALEYLAMERPTVVASAGDLRHLAIVGVALSYEPGNSEDLADRLEALARDDSLRSRLGQAGRSYASRHSWRASARMIVQDAERLLRTASVA